MDNEMKSLVEDLADRVDDLEDQLAEEREQRRDLEEWVEELDGDLQRERAKRRRAERQARAAVAHSRRLWDKVENVDRLLTDGLEGLHARVSAVAEGASDDASEVEDVEEAEALLPIQQLAKMPEHVAEEQLNNENHRNTFRARSIWKDFGDYADRTPTGFVLESGRLQRVLRAQAEEEDYRIDTNTAKRVMARLVEFSKGIAERRKKDGQWRVFVPEDWPRQAREAAEVEGNAAVTRGG